jgi:hypothetical protein
VVLSPRWLLKVVLLELCIWPVSRLCVCVCVCVWERECVCVCIACSCSKAVSEPPALDVLRSAELDPWICNLWLLGGFSPMQRRSPEKLLLLQRRVGLGQLVTLSQCLSAHRMMATFWVPPNVAAGPCRSQALSPSSRSSPRLAGCCCSQGILMDSKLLAYFISW